MEKGQWKIRTKSGFWKKEEMADFRLGKNSKERSWGRLSVTISKICSDV